MRRLEKSRIHPNFKPDDNTPVQATPAYRDFLEFLWKHLHTITIVVHKRKFSETGSYRYRDT